MRLPEEATIAGSIRRQKKIVHDIDVIVGEHLNCFLRSECEGIEHLTELIKIVKWGPKLAAIKYCGFPIDLYFSTPQTFNTLLLIRTGSKENNIRLATIAKRKGWKLHASGEGLFDDRGERIAGDSERSIYEALGVPWQEPWERG